MQQRPLEEADRANPACAKSEGPVERYSQVRKSLGIAARILIKRLAVYRARREEHLAAKKHLEEFTAAELVEVAVLLCLGKINPGCYVGL